MLRTLIFLAALSSLNGCTRSDNQTLAIAAEPPSENKPLSQEGLAQLPKEAPKETPKEEKASTLFEFPKDEAGNLLKKTLEPQTPTGFKNADKSQFVERDIPYRLAAPSVATLPVPHPILRKTPKNPVEVAPRPLAMPFPDSATPSDPNLPARQPFPTAPLIDTKGNDPTAPAPVSSMARPEPSRAPIYDPTPEYTASRVISIILPLRTDTSPYIRISLPEPAETSAPKTPTLPSDDTLPSFVPPPPPARPQ